MPNLNKVFLMGNLTRDPELRYTPGGMAVSEFGIAVSRRWKGPNGETRDETCFVDITAWGRQAEVVSEYLKKGRPVFIEGRLQYDQWEGPDGQKRSKLRVVLENFQFLGARGPEGPSGEAERGGTAPRQTSKPPSASHPAPEEQPPEAGASEVTDDEIPF